MHNDGYMSQEGGDAHGQKSHLREASFSVGTEIKGDGVAVCLVVVVHQVQKTSHGQLLNIETKTS